MDTKQTLALIVLIFLLILILRVAGSASSPSEWIKKIGIGNIYEWNSMPIKDTEWGNTNTTETPRSTTYSYQLVDTTNSSGLDPYGKVFYNAKLIKVFGDGRTETVVGNFRNRFSNILIEPNQMLIQYYFPPNSDILYFSFRTYYTTGTDNRYHIYRYNVNTDEMKDLFSNRYLTSYVVPSPYDQLLLMAIDDDTILTYKRLYLVNLSNDNTRLLVELHGDETFATSPPDSSGRRPSADVVWIGKNDVGYGVYRYVNGANVFRERRQLPI